MLLDVLELGKTLKARPYLERNLMELEIIKTHNNEELEIRIEPERNLKDLRLALEDKGL